MIQEEFLFFEKMPSMLPVYQAFRKRLEECCFCAEVKVGKTQITFRNRHVFAMASLPWRKVKNWPAEYLMISFGLSYEIQSPRIMQAVEPYPNRWTHHVLLQREEEVDTQLMEWVQEAYQFSMVK